MEIDDLFQSSGRWIAGFFEMQVHLYRHDTRLQDYFLRLQMDTRNSPRLKSSDLHTENWLVTLALHGADSVNRLRPRRTIKTDVLFCPIPYFARKTENQLIARILLGLAQTDAKILCLLPDWAPCRDELRSTLATAGRTNQVEFLDPAAPLNRMDARLRSRLEQRRAHSALADTVRVLEPMGLSPGSEVKGGFECAAHFVEAWESVAPSVEFDAVVARCHWNTLCSAVCRTGLQRGKPVITFQQGVIGHTLDAPVAASKYVAFGQPSANFLARMNQRFYDAAGMPEPPVEYVNGGCLYDPVTVLPDQFALQTLLLVDIPVEPGDFYGIQSQGEALLQLAEKLLAENSTLRRLIIRPHPYWSTLDLEPLQRLVREHSTRCELSHPAWSLEDDLRRSSVAVGIFSGVLTVASACGLPAIFLKTEQGYATGDLECFSRGQTLGPDVAFREIKKLLTDPQSYSVARMQALENGREYYSNGRNLDFNAAFFERLLQAEPGIDRPQKDL